MTRTSRFLVAVVVTLGLAACGSDTPTAEPSAGTPAPVASVSPSPEPSGEPSPPEGAPSIDDVAQEMAAGFAEDYLAIMPMSRDALIDQLASDAGDGFGTDVAARAVDSLDVDWNEQAARAAQEYAAEGMTRAEIVQQLTSSYDRYTVVQAEYAADQVG